MPTYDYKCEACGHAFEKFQSMTSAVIKKCPKCGKNKVKRLIGTGAGLIFKGSGFYITDYRSEGYKDKAKADGAAPAAATSDAPAAASTETKSESKTESKPTETKAESKPAPKVESKPQKASKSAKK